MVPPGAVFEIAPAKVLHGAVRLHGLASSPTPETHVRVAWACAGTEPSIGTQMRPRAASSSELRIAFPPPTWIWEPSRPSCPSRARLDGWLFSSGETVPRTTRSTALHTSVAGLCLPCFFDEIKHQYSRTLSFSLAFSQLGHAVKLESLPIRAQASLRATTLRVDATFEALVAKRAGVVNDCGGKRAKVSSAGERASH